MSITQYSGNASIDNASSKPLRQITPAENQVFLAQQKVNTLTVQFFETLSQVPEQFSEDLSACLNDLTKAHQLHAQKLTSLNQSHYASFRARLTLYKDAIHDRDSRYEGLSQNFDKTTDKLSKEINKLEDELHTMQENNLHLASANAQLRSQLQDSKFFEKVLISTAAVAGAVLAYKQFRTP
jgi:hypothetical protein